MGNDGSGMLSSGIAADARNLHGRAGGNMEETLALPLVSVAGLVPVLYGEEMGDGVIGQRREAEPDMPKFASGEPGGESEDTRSFLFKIILFLTSSTDSTELFTKVLDNDEGQHFCGIDISMESFPTCICSREGRACLGIKGNEPTKTLHWKMN